MNDHRLPPDELASAFLDDELGAAEADAVRKDPDLAARAGELLGAAEAVGETVAPPPGAADAAVEAALADFDARRRAPADMARRPRSLAVIAGVAAVVLVGFIVAAAVGLFTEQADDADEVAALAPAPAPAPQAEAAAPPAEAPGAPPPAAAEILPEPAPPAPEFPPPPATMAAVEVQAAEPLPADAFIADEAPADEAAVAEAQTALEEAQAAADAAGAEAAAAVADFGPAGEAAALPEAAEAAPAPPADMEEMPAEDMEADDDPSGPAADVTADPAQASCAGVIGDRTVGLQFIIGGTPILIVQSADGTIAALDGTTCAPIPPDDGSELVADPAPDGCSEAIGDRAIPLRFVIGGTPILIVQSADGTIAALDGTTCAPIPPG